MKKLTLGFVVLSLLFFASVDQSLAQGYPNRAIRFIVPYTPGGTQDVMGRIVGDKLSEAWGQPVVVENRSGAGGMIGTAYVKSSPPDGYTFLISSGADLCMVPHLHTKMPYDTLNDFVPVAYLGSIPVLLVVNSSVPAKSVKELVEFCKAKPGGLTYGSPGSGTPHHLAAEQFKKEAGVNMTHVPYKGSAPAYVDLLSGQIQVMFAFMNSIMPHIKSGGVRVLGVASQKRTAFLPELPTLDEGGVHGIYAEGWANIVAPRGISPDIVNKMNREVVKIIGRPDIVSKYKTLNMETMTGTPAELAAQIRDDCERWGKIIKAAGIRAD